MSRQSLVEELQRLVSLPSVNPFEGPAQSPPPEEAMATYLERRFDDLGLEKGSQEVLDGRRNVWGRLPGTGEGPRIMLAGHMDTVGVEGYDNPFEPRYEDGRVYGRGSVDMKASFAVFFEVIQRLKASDVPLASDIIVGAVVDEEHAMLGSELFGRTGPKIEFAIVAEPSGLQICPVHKGQICLSLHTKGLSVHSSLPEKGINAIFHMSRLVVALEDYAATLSNRPAHPLCGKPSLSVGVVKGGTNVSSVPDWAEIEIDRRTIPGETFDGVMAELEDVIKRAAKDIPNLDYSFGPPSLNVPPLQTDTEGKLVKALKAASDEVLEVRPPIASFSGSTDAPNFRCEAVICGPGNLAQAHSLNEFIEVSEMETAVELYLQTIQRLQP